MIDVEVNLTWQIGDVNVNSMLSPVLFCFVFLLMFSFAPISIAKGGLGDNPGGFIQCTDVAGSESRRSTQFHPTVAVKEEPGIGRLAAAFAEMRT